MTVNAVMLMAALVLSGTVLAQSSSPSAGSAGAGQAANPTATGQALNSNMKTSDNGPPIEPTDKAGRPAKPDAGAAGNTVGASRPQKKPDRRLEHYP
jgi:hypothetical protein